MKRIFAFMALAGLMLTVSPSYAQNGQPVAATVECDERTEQASALPTDTSATAPVAAPVANDTVAAAPADRSVMEKLVGFCLEHLNYGTVTLFMAIESSFIPFPSEAVVPPAAWKAATTGEMNIVLVVIFATLGAIIGALINYYLALWLGRPIVYRFARSRFGRMCLIDEDKVKHAEEYFEKHGAVSTFFGRLIPAVRQLISIPAGLIRMKMSKFMLYTALGAGAWNIVLAALGYAMKFVPGMDSEEAVMAAVKEHSSTIGMVFVILAVLAIGYVIYKGMKKSKK